MLILVAAFGCASVNAQPSSYDVDNSTIPITGNVTGDLTQKDAVKVTGSGNTINVGSVNLTGKGHQNWSENLYEGGNGLAIKGDGNNLTNNGSIGGGSVVQSNPGNYGGHGVLVEGDGATITNETSSIIIGGTAQWAQNTPGSTGGDAIKIQGSAGNGSVVISNGTNALVQGGKAFDSAADGRGGAGINIYQADAVTIDNEMGGVIAGGETHGIGRGSAFGGAGVHIDQGGVVTINNKTGAVIRGGAAHNNSAAHTSTSGDGMHIVANRVTITNEAGALVQGGTTQHSGSFGYGGRGMHIESNDTTVSNSGTIAGGLAGNTKNAAGGDALYILGNDAILDNSGVIMGGGATFPLVGTSETGAGGSAVIIEGDSFKSISNTGTIAGGNGIISNARYSNTGGHGLMITATAQAANPGSITNSGLIAGGTSQNGTYGSGGHGVYMNGSITNFENSDTGRITAGSASATGTSMGGSGVIINGASYGKIINDGIITGGAANNGTNRQAGHGLSITATNQAIGVGVIKNSGTITAGSSASGVIGTGGHGVHLDGNLASFENELGGRITAGSASASGTSTAGSGVTITTDSFDAITNAGYISGGNAYSSGSGTAQAGHGIAVTATSQLTASGSVKNSGTIIAGNNSGGAFGAGGHGVSIEGNLEYFENTAGAQITAGSASATGTSMGGSGVIINGASYGKIINDGIITGGAANNGTNRQAGHGLSITATNQAIGVGVIKNSGTITAGSSASGVIGTGGHGVHLDGNLASFENELGGRITAGSASASGTSTAGSGVTITTDSFDAITNAGYISGGNAYSSGSGTAQAGHGIAVTATSQLTASGSVKNSGTIIAGNNSGGAFGAGGHGVSIEGNLEYFENTAGAQITAGAASASGTSTGGSGVTITTDSFDAITNAGYISGGNANSSGSGTAQAGHGIAVTATSQLTTSGSVKNSGTIIAGNNSGGAFGAGGHGVSIEGSLEYFENTTGAQITAGAASASGTSMGGSGVIIDGASYREIINAGMITGGAANNGTNRQAGHGLSITATNQAAGVGVIKNSGTITAGSSAGGVIGTGGHGVYLDGNFASFENELGGRITAGSSSASGTSTAGSGLYIDADSYGAIINAGIISGGVATNGTLRQGGHGVTMTGAGMAVATGTVKNSGAISGGSISGGMENIGGDGINVTGNLARFDNESGARIVGGSVGGSGTSTAGSGVSIAGNIFGEVLNAGLIAGGTINGGNNSIVLRQSGNGLSLIATDRSVISGTVKNSGTIAAGNIFGDPWNTRFGIGGHGVYVDGNLARFENDSTGLITGGSSATTTAGSGVLIVSSSFGEMLNKGDIIGGNIANGGQAGHGVHIQGDDATVTNMTDANISGGDAMWVSSTGGHGIFIEGNNVTVSNTGGRIAGGAAHDADPIARGGHGLSIAGADATVNNTGDITGGAAYSAPESAAGHGLHISGTGAIVNNKGNITGGIARGTADAEAGHGLAIEGALTSLNNTGLIIGGTTMDADNGTSGHGLHLEASAPDTTEKIITNTGTITGGHALRLTSAFSGHGIYLGGDYYSIINKDGGLIEGGTAIEARTTESGHGIHVLNNNIVITNTGNARVIGGEAGCSGGGFASTAGHAINIIGDAVAVKNSAGASISGGFAGGGEDHAENNAGAGIQVLGDNANIINEHGAVIMGGNADSYIKNVFTNEWYVTTNNAGAGIHIGKDSAVIENKESALISGGTATGLYKSGTAIALAINQGGHGVDIDFQASGTVDAGMFVNGGTVKGGDSLWAAQGIAGSGININGYVKVFDTGSGAVHGGNAVGVINDLGASASAIGGHALYINDASTSASEVKSTHLLAGGDATGAQTNEGGDGVRIDGANYNITNSGTILGGAATGGTAHTDGYGININAATDSAQITNTGEVSGESGIRITNATSGTIYNTGTITATGTANRAIELASANIISKFDTGSVLNGDVHSSGTGNKLVFQGTVTEDSYFRSDATANNFAQLTVQTDGTSNTHWTLTGSTTQLDGVNAIAINDGANNTTATLTITPADDADYNFAHALSGDGTLEIALKQSANIISFGTVTGNAFTGTVALGTGRFVLGGTANSQGATNLATLENATLRIDADNRTEVEGTGAIAGLSFNSGTLAVRTSNTTGVNHVEDLLTVSGTLDTTGGGTVEVALSGTAFGPIPATPPSAPALLDQDDYVDSGTAGMVQGPLVAVDVDNGGTVTGIGTQLTIDFIPSSSSTGTIPGSVSSTSAYVQSGTHVANLVYDYYGAVTGSGIYLNYGLAEIDALDGQTVVVSNDGAANDTLGAILSGDGGYTFTATGNSSIRVGNVNSNYTGTTTITSGTVITITNGAFGNTDYLVINNAGALDLNGRTQTIANGGQIDGILHGSGSLGFGGLVTITSTNTTFTADVGVTGTAVLHNTSALGDSGTLFNDGLAQFTAATGTFSKTLAGAGNTELANSSTVSVSGSNTAYSGTFIINTGNRLVAETDANLGAANITGSGVFEKQNAATTITIGHANNGFTGTAAVTAGRLAATTIDALGTAEIAVEAGAIFEHLNVTGTLQNKLTGAGTHHVTNSTLTIDDAAKYKITNTTLNQPSTLWLATNGVTIGTLNANSGTLAFANPVDTATIGALGSGTANIVMNAYLAQATIGVNPAGTVANHLTIDDAGNATHSVYINALSEPPLALNMAIELITTGTGAATFLLANEGGKLEYDLTTIELVKGDGSRYTPDTNIWYLSDRNLSHAADAIINTASTLSLDWASAMDSLHLRLGDIRAEWREQPARDSGNIWVRSRGYRINAANELSGMSFRQYGWGVTGGADKSFAAENGVNLLGGFIDMGGVDRKFDNDGTGRTRSVGVGAYITLLRQNGWFLDGIARFDRYDNDFDAKAANGRVTRGEYTAKGQSLSLEAGRRLQRTDGWWLEPGVQMAVLWLNGASYSTQATSEQRALKVKVGDSDTWQYRALMRFGKQIPNSRWTPYGKLAAVAVDSNGGRIKVHGKTFSADYDGRRIEFGLGTSYRLDDLSQLYIDYEYAKAAAYDRPWSLNLGYRRLW
ncbi:pertactin-like passenger domain-containing protein [Ereboglobus luteus]|nr:pertactin-like passenger domain-containing protein [Ereboglobus luteus]